MGYKTSTSFETIQNYYNALENKDGAKIGFDVEFNMYKLYYNLK